MSIEVRQISKTYGAFRALKGVNLKVESGELVALLGPSGSGKTTLLRIIAGIEAADAGGEVLFDDVDVSDTNLGKRRIGFVFQHYALFKQMSVFENIAFGLRSKPWRSGPRMPQIKAKVDELLSLVQLSNFAQRYPSQLSGGQRQRVALARALAVEPHVLLLDEPFGALDATVRRELRRWLRKLHKTIKVTTIFVTHDQEEALEVSDRVAVMNNGHIEQYNSPEEVYEHPANPLSSASSAITISSTVGWRRAVRRRRHPNLRRRKASRPLPSSGRTMSKSRAPTAAGRSRPKSRMSGLPARRLMVMTFCFLRAARSLLSFS